MDVPTSNPVPALVSGMMPTPAAAASLRNLPDVQGCDVLLCGPASSFRSSLAIHFALHHAARTMLPAVFLCRQEGLEQHVPLLPHFYDGDDPSLHLLHIKYVNSPGDLQRWASCLHLQQGAYSAIVVEDINSVAGADDRNLLIRTLAMLTDGVRAYRASSGFGATGCPLLVTDSSDDSRRPRYIYDRWLPVAVLLAPSTPPSGPDGSFTLTLASSSSSSSASASTLGGQYGADGRPSAAPPDASQAAAASDRSGLRCWYRPSGGRLVLETVHCPDGPDARALPFSGAGRGAASRVASGSQAAATAAWY